MQKFILLILLYFLATNAYSQIEKNISIKYNGTLANVLTAEELCTTTKLTLTGNIDARDFKTMRDEMPLLTEIDLRGVTILAYNGDQGTETLTNYYEGNTIPRYSMRNKNTLTSIYLPISITSIQPSAFYQCTKLFRIEMHEGIKTISNNSFLRCDSLTEITIPASVDYIAPSAFERRVSYFVDSDNQHYSSENGVLYNKDKTKLLHAPLSLSGEFMVPETILEIYESAFKGCSLLTKVTLPIGLQQIGLNSFYGCSSLLEINIPPTIKQIDDYAFSGCSNLLTINLPESIMQIKQGTFSNCNSLVSANIPSSVNKIYSNSFYKCLRLENLYVMPVNPVDIGNSSSVFQSVNTATCKLNVPFGSLKAYQNTAGWKGFQNIFELPGIYTSSDSVKFGSNGDTKKLHIASSVSWKVVSDQNWLSISPKSGEMGIDSLTIVVEANITTTSRVASITICGEGFENIKITVLQYGYTEVSAGNLKTILGDQLATITSLSLVGTIDARDFITMRDDMPLLEEIDLSESTIIAFEGNISAHPFDWQSYGNNEIPHFAMNNGQEGKKTLKSIVLPSNITAIKDEAFLDCSNLNRINFPEGIRTISHGSFIGCKLFKTITIPASVEYVAFGAFDRKVSYSVEADNQHYSSEDGILYNSDKTIILNVPSIKSGEFKVMETVVEVNERAFLGCSLLSSIILPVDLSNIGSEAFASCISLSNIIMPIGLKKIGADAFNNCLSLVDINIPSTVTQIDDGAFSKCSKLRAITLPEGITQISDVLFYDCSSLTSVNIPANVKYIGDYAFKDCSSIQNIYAMPVTPADMHDYYNVFDGINSSACILHVPIGSIEAYQTNYKWERFQNIVEMQGIYFSNNEVEFGSNASSKKIYYASSVEWSATSDQNWLSISPASGGACIDSMELVVEENLTNTLRTATITISSEGYDDKTIAVMQYGINQVTPGNLKSFYKNQLSSITSLRLNGTIDARDFKTMRDDMPLLKEIDLSGVSIVAYYGEEGTCRGLTYYEGNKIPQYSMYRKNTLTFIVLPDNITAINPYAFYGCDRLFRIEMQEGIKSISNYSFVECDSLTEVSITASVVDINSYAFDRRISFFVDTDNQHYSSENGVLYNKDKTALLHAPISLSGEYKVPESVLRINESAFEGCSLLIGVTLPESITQINEGVFYNCLSLQNIYAMPVNPIDIGNLYSVFQSVNTASCTLHVPFGSLEAYKNASRWKDFQNIVELPGIFLKSDSVIFGTKNNIKKFYFASSTSWNAVPDQSWLSISTTSGENGTDSLTISVEANTTSTSRIANITISGEGFDDKNIIVLQYGKTEVTAGNLRAILSDQLAKQTTLTLIGNIDARDFRTMRDEMPLLEEIDMSEVAIVAYNGGQGTCINSLTYYENNHIPQFAMSKGGGTGKLTLKSIVLPKSVTAIKDDAFSYCFNLNGINLPEGIKQISDRSFIRCELLTTITIPSSVENIALGAFDRKINYLVNAGNQHYSSEDGVLYNADKTIIMKVPSTISSKYKVCESVVEISEKAFEDCNALTNIVLPSELRKIGAFAFKNCISLSEIDVPSTLTQIDDGAFYNCSKLTTIQLSEGIEYIGSVAFFDCTSLTSLRIPSTIMYLGSTLFYNCNNLNSIYSLSFTPLKIGFNWHVLNFLFYSGCILYVPYGSKAAYEAAYHWQDFQHIVELPKIQDTLLVLNQTISDVEAICFNATQTITVAGDGTYVTVEPNASATFIAGQSIRFLPGFHVQNGSYVSAYITTDGSFCDMLPQSIVQNTPEPYVFEKSVTLENRGEQVLEQMLKAYPNPSSGLFTIEMENFGDQKQVEIINITGQTVYKQLTNENKINIDISTLNKGLYIIYCNDRFTTKTQRVVLN